MTEKQISAFTLFYLHPRMWVRLYQWVTLEAVIKYISIAQLNAFVY
jgi:hypothetical protein